MTEKQTFEGVIARQGKLVYTNVGDSMYPLIQPRDLQSACATVRHSAV